MWKHSLQRLIDRACHQDDFNVQALSCPPLDSIDDAETVWMTMQQHFPEYIQDFDVDLNVDVIELLSELHHHIALNPPHWHNAIAKQIFQGILVGDYEAYGPYQAPPQDRQVVIQMHVSHGDYVDIASYIWSGQEQRWYQWRPIGPPRPLEKEPNFETGMCVTRTQGGGGSFWPLSLANTNTLPSFITAGYYDAGHCILISGHDSDYLHCTLPRYEVQRRHQVQKLFLLHEDYHDEEAKLLTSLCSLFFEDPSSAQCHVLRESKAIVLEGTIVNNPATHEAIQSMLRCCLPGASLCVDLCQPLLVRPGDSRLWDNGRKRFTNRANHATSILYGAHACPHLRLTLPELEDELARLAVELFPQDLPVWLMAGGQVHVTEDGRGLAPTFAPAGDDNGVSYQLRTFTLVRNDSVSAVLPREYPSSRLSEMTFDWSLGRAMLQACQTWRRDNNHDDDYMVVDLARDAILLADKQVIRYSALQPRLGSKSVSTALATACALFYASIRLLPLDPMVRARRHEAAWKKVLPRPLVQWYMDCGPAHQSPDVHGLLQRALAHGLSHLVIVAPCGTGKTTAMKQLPWRGDVVTSSKALAKNLFGELQTHHFYRDPVTDTVWPQHKMRDMPGSMTFVINSIQKVLATRPNPMTKLLMDESTDVWFRTTGALMKTSGPQVVPILLNVIRQSSQTILMSANATAELEGRIISELLGLADKLGVLYKVHGHSAASSTCIEFKSDPQLWHFYCRVLVHNSQCQPDARLNLYFQCTTVRAVETARDLCQSIWPEGLAEQVCVFLHASSSDVPQGFVERPNDTWVNFCIVCLSTCMKVGLSFTKVHFHINLAYWTNMCASSMDVEQLDRRVRPVFPLVLYRIRLMGGGGGGGRRAVDTGTLVRQTDVALDEHMRTFGIDNTTVDKTWSREYDQLIQWTEAIWQDDQAHFTRRVRDGMRRRQMTLQLGGLWAEPDQELVLPPTSIDVIAVLPPIPEKYQIVSQFDVKQALIEAILDAPDLTDDEFRILGAAAKSRRMLQDEEAMFMRKKITKLYPRWEEGPVPFDQLVYKHIKGQLAQKVDRVRTVFDLDERSMGRVDHFELHTLVPRDRSYQLIVRQNVLAFLKIMPGLNDPRLELTRAEPTYCVARDTLEAEEPWIRQDAMLNDCPALLHFLDGQRSTISGDGVKRCISTFNQVTRRMGLPTLEPGKRSDRKRRVNGKVVQRTTRVESWSLVANDTATLFLAGLWVWDAPIPNVAEERVLEDPFDLYADKLVHAQEGTFSLASPFPTTPPMQGWCLYIDKASPECRELVNSRLAWDVGQLSECPGAQLQVVPVLFHARRLVQFVYPSTLKHRIEPALHQVLKRPSYSGGGVSLAARWSSRASITPFPHDPTYCLKRRILLTVQGHAWCLQDQSDYFSDDSYY